MTKTFQLIVLLFLSSCSLSKKTSEKTYTCFPDILGIEVYSDGKEFAWTVSSTNTTINFYFREHFSFPNKLEKEFIEQNLFFEVNYVVNEFGKIVNIKVDNKQHEEHIEIIKSFLESIPHFNLSEVDTSTNYKYSITIGTRIILN